jgi:hypothetical protein
MPVSFLVFSLTNCAYADPSTADLEPRRDGLSSIEAAAMLLANLEKRPDIAESCTAVSGCWQNTGRRRACCPSSRQNQNPSATTAAASAPDRVLGAVPSAKMHQ